MRDISSMNIVQIDVTNLCNKSCSNCTRFCGHYTKDKIFFMSPEYYEKAVISFKDFPAIVGMIGGEPTLHPQFEELCKILQKHIPKHKCGLWTNTTTQQFVKYRDIINETFGVFNLNNHIDTNSMHAPILTAIDDLDATSDQKKYFIDNCWVQLQWSATINPNGGFFCEVAGAFSMLFNGPNGADIEANPGWWKKPISEFNDQINEYCHSCGCAVPLTPRRSITEIDDISTSTLEKLKLINSPKVAAGKFEINNGLIDLAHMHTRGDWYRTY